MKKWICFLLAALLCASCGLGEGADAAAPKRVLALSGSLAEIYLLAGGELAGVTDDALEEHALPLGDAVVRLGSLKDPNAELILSLEPDLVILAADLEKQRRLGELLEARGIAVYAAKVENSADYLAALGDFCALTGREDLYAQNGLRVMEAIAAQKARVCGSDRPSALVLRLYATGMKVKAGDTVLCDILDDLGVVNVAAGNPALEELSLEAIAAANPDYIFAVVMGADEEGALARFEETLDGNPVWRHLDAVAAKRLYVLPRELFHFKPNARWAQAYRYLIDILWPEAS